MMITSSARKISPTTADPSKSPRTHINVNMKRDQYLNTDLVNTFIPNPQIVNQEKLYTRKYTFFSLICLECGWNLRTNPNLPNVRTSSKISRGQLTSISRPLNNPELKI